MRRQLELKAVVRQEHVEERRQYYSGQNWPFYESTHDKLLEELVKADKDLEMAAATGVGISLKNWRASLQAHFAYPNKDAALIKAYHEELEKH